MKKKLFTICLSIFLWHLCFAQNDAAIFFFRYNSVFPLTGNIIPYHLYHDGKQIHKLPGYSFYLNKADQISGTYTVKLPWWYWPYNKSKSTITVKPGTITIVAMKENFWSFNKHILRTTSLDGFEKAYNHKRWLRKKMAKAGFKSIEELIKGYKVNE